MEQPRPSYRREVYQPPPPSPLMGQYQFQNRPPPQYLNRPRVLGPCFSCGAYGHLAASCGAKERPYPLNQPVVSSAADVSEFIHQSTCGVCVDNVAAGSARGIECVDEATTKVSEHVTNGESVDSTEGNGMYDLHEFESCSMHEVECSATYNVNSSDMCSEINPKFWEVESSGLKQITDVQGRLKKHLMYWKNVLHAPPPILDCIENGYRLLLKFVPPTHFQRNHNSTATHNEFVNEAIENLVKNRCVALLNVRPYVCSPPLSCIKLIRQAASRFQPKVPESVPACLEF